MTDPFRGTKRHVTCFVTVTGRSAQPTLIAFGQWQNGRVERLIGSIRRESLDHLIVFDEAQLRRVLKNYASYYNQVRTHLALDKNGRIFVARRSSAPSQASILGGLHHQYVRA